MEACMQATKKSNRLRGGAVVAGVALGVGLLVVLGLVEAKPAEAAFPGTNGKIAFTSDRDGNEEVYVMNVDGFNQINLTNNPAFDAQPDWGVAPQASGGGHHHKHH